MKKTDSDFVKRIRSGSQEPLKEIYKENFRPIINYVKKNSGNEDDGKDVLQEAVFIFWEKVNNDDFELSASVSTYIYAVSRNIWLSRLRKNKMNVSFDENYIESAEFEGFEDVLEQGQNTETKAALDCLGQATEHCRTILTYYYFEKIPNKEIAKLMNLKNDDTVKVAKYKCFKKLEICVETKIGNKIQKI